MTISKIILFCVIIALWLLFVFAGTVYLRFDSLRMNLQRQMHQASAEAIRWMKEGCEPLAEEAARPFQQVLTALEGARKAEEQAALLSRVWQLVAGLPRDAGMERNFILPLLAASKNYNISVDNLEEFLSAPSRQWLAQTLHFQMPSKLNIPVEQL